MKKLNALLTIVVICLLGSSTLFAKDHNGATDDIQSTAQSRMIKKRPAKWKITGTADASMFQMALLELGGNQEFSTLRYSLFFNTGFHINRKIGNNLTLFSGLNFKNLGLIYRTDTLVQKYRSYTVGAPIGLKIGTAKEYILLGGGVDIPFHSRKKQWTKGERGTKIKNNEWFSDEVNSVLAYGFLGYRFKNSLTLKAVYYPTNYWSDSFVKGNRSNIFMLTVGFDVNKGSTGRVMEMSTKKKINRAFP